MFVSLCSVVPFGSDLTVSSPVMIPFNSMVTKIPTGKGLKDVREELCKMNLKVKVCEHYVATGNSVFHIFEHHSKLTIEELQLNCALFLEGNIDNVQDVILPFLQYKKLDIADYCVYITKPGFPADEVALHLLAYVTGIHVCVVYSRGEWVSCDSPDRWHCSIVLAYVGGSAFVQVDQDSEKTQSGESSSSTEIYDVLSYLTPRCQLPMRRVTRSTVQALLSLGNDLHVPLEQSSCQQLCPRKQCMQRNASMQTTPRKRASKSTCKETIRPPRIHFKTFGLRKWKYPCKLKVL